MWEIRVENPGVGDCVMQGGRNRSTLGIIDDKPGHVII